MPEGPELHMSGLFVNNFANGRIFSGRVTKSEVSKKNPDIDWDEPKYTIISTTRGKEIKFNLTTIITLSDQVKSELKAKPCEMQPKKLWILFRFGMSGKFMFLKESEMDKHCHLNFFCQDDDMVMSFNDYRRFGRWELVGEEDWGKDRGPCIILEYALFRKHVLENIKGSLLDRPICEVMLNQKYFNGVGNYLRAEVLYRLQIPPFVSTRSVLEPIQDIMDCKSDKPDPDDLIKLCSDLAHEVIKLEGGFRYIDDPRETEVKDSFGFSEWLQCYYQKGMSNLLDHNKRPIWFKGPAGPLKPKESKSVGKKRQKKTSILHEDKKEAPASKVKKEGEDGYTDRRTRSANRR